MVLLRNKAAGMLAELRHLPRFARLLREACGWRLGVWVGLTIVAGVLPAAALALMAPLVDALAAISGSAADGLPGRGFRPADGGETIAGSPELVASLQPVFALVVALGAVLVLGVVSRGLSSWLRSVQVGRITDHVTALIHENAVALDLAFFESAGYYDDLHRARDEARHRPGALLETCGAVLQNGVTLIAMAAVLARFGWLVPVVLLASAGPAFVLMVRLASRQHRRRRQMTQDERRGWYYDWLLTARGPAGEVRLFDLGSRYRLAYQAVHARLRRQRLRLAGDALLAEAGAGAAGLLVLGGAMIWMLWQMAAGRATLGSLVLFYQAFHQGHAIVRALLENAGQLYHHSLCTGDLFRFLDLQPRITDRPGPPLATTPGEDGAIRFERVTFAYPGSRRPALNGCTLTIQAGQIAAILGPNGAGKSSLLKLLCRFYEPDAGRIAIGRRNLDDLPIRELRHRITALFQEPVQFSATVAENVLVGSNAEPVAASRLAAALHGAAAERVVARLPGGAGALLGRWFDGGQELSVGEWQRIALARALARDAAIVLLDEPTSAMDPWTEAVWFERLRASATGRTIVMVTHRLTTAMRADMIHVLDEGRIVESGSHVQLRWRGGRYAQLWDNEGLVLAADTRTLGVA